MQIVSMGDTGGRIFSFSHFMRTQESYHDIQGHYIEILLYKNCNEMDRVAGRTNASNHDFEGVEWVFNFLDLFLQAHQSHVYNTILCEAMKVAFDSVTPQDDIAKHFCFEGYTFEPYMDQQ